MSAGSAFGLLAQALRWRARHRGRRAAGGAAPQGARARERGGSTRADAATWPSCSASWWARPSPTRASVRAPGRAPGSGADAASSMRRAFVEFLRRRVRGAAGAARARGSALGRPAHGALHRRGAAPSCASCRSWSSRAARPEVHELFPRLWAGRHVQELRLRDAGAPGQRAPGAAGARRRHRRRRRCAASSSAPDGQRVLPGGADPRGPAEARASGCPRRCWPWCRRASSGSIPRRGACCAPPACSARPSGEAASTRCSATAAASALARRALRPRGHRAGRAGALPRRGRVRLPPRAGARGRLRHADRGAIARSATSSPAPGWSRTARPTRMVLAEHFERGRGAGARGHLVPARRRAGAGGRRPRRRRGARGPRVALRRHGPGAGVPPAMQGYVTSGARATARPRPAIARRSTICRPAARTGTGPSAATSTAARPSAISSAWPS